jgi:hypothetical protein
MLKQVQHDEWTGHLHVGSRQKFSCLVAALAIDREPASEQHGIISFRERYGR